MNQKVTGNQHGRRSRLGATLGGIAIVIGVISLLASFILSSASAMSMTTSGMVIGIGVIVVAMHFWAPPR